MSAPSAGKNLARACLLAAAGALLSTTVQAVDYTKANNTTALGVDGAYDIAGVPTSADAVIFGTAFDAGTGTSVNYGTPLTLSGLVLGAVTGAEGSTVILGADTIPQLLTLGAGGLTTTGTNMDWVLGNQVALSFDQTWSLAGGRYVRLGNAANAGVLSGSANLFLARTGTGVTTLDLNASGTGLTNFSGKLFVGEGVLARTSQSNAAAWGSGLVYLQGGSIGVGGQLDATKGNWTWNTGIVVGPQGGTIDNTNNSGSNRTLTLNSVIAGSGNLTFANQKYISSTDGNLVFYVQKDSGLTGTVTIAANAQVRMGNSGVTGSLGSGNIVINSSVNPALNLGRTGILQLTNSISGTGRVDIGNGITSGLTVFSGTNTYAGLTAIYGTAATFVQASSLSTTSGNLGAGTIALVGGNLLYTGAGETVTRTLQVGAVTTSGIYANGAGALVWNPGGLSNNGTSNARTIILGGTGTAQNSIGANFGSLSTTLSNVSLRKSNAGTWNLTTTQTYTGNTEVAGGTLRLNLATADSILPSANTLSFTGSGTLDLVGRSAGTLTQTLGAVTLSAGNATLQATLNGGTGLTLATGGFTRSAGATLTFAGNSGGAIIGTSQTNTNGIIGTGWAFIQNGANDFDFAVANGSAANVSAFSGYTTLTAAGASSATTNYSLALSGTTTMTGAFTGNVLKLSNATGASTWALGANAATVRSVLVTGASTGGVTVTGTAALGNTTGEFVLNNSSAGTLTIQSPLLGAGAGSLVKTGAGLVVVQPSGGNNAFTGAVSVNQGELRSQVGTTAGTYTPLGSGAITVHSGATLRFLTGSTSNAFTYANAVNLRDATFVSDDGTNTFSGNFNATGWNTFEVRYSAKNAVLQGVLSGSGFLTKTGSGALILDNAANTFTGYYVVNAGSLQAGTGATPATRLGNAAGVIINSGGTLRHDINANSGNTSLFTNSTAVIQINSGGLYNGYVTESASGGTIMTQTVPKFILAGGEFRSGGSNGSALINFATHLETVAGTTSTIYQTNNGGFTNNGMAFTGVEVSGSGNITMTRQGGGNTSRFWWLGWRSGNANAFSGNVTLSASTSPGDYYFGTVGGWGAGQLIASGAGASAILGDYSAQGAWATAGVVTGTMHVLGGFQVGPSAQLRLLNRSDSQFVSAEIAGSSTLTGGTLGLAGSYASPGAFIPFTGATWTVGGSAVSTIAAPLSLNYSGVTFDVADAVAGSGVDLLVSGQVRGDRQLTKSGAGTLALTAANSHTGGYNVTAGTLSLGNNGTAGDLGSGAVALGASGTLALNRSNNVTVANALTGSGTVSKLASAGVATLTGNLSAFSGTLAVQSGTASVTNVLALSGVSTGASATVGQFAALRSLGAAALGNVTLVSGGQLQVELGSPTLATSFFTTTGTLAFVTGADVVVSNTSAVTAGTYRLVNYSSGALTFDGSSDLTGLVARGLAPSRNTFTLVNDTVAKTLDLAVTGSAANLVWNGTLGTWDSSQASGVGRAFTNLADSQADWFYNFDQVTFDASVGPTPQVVTLDGTLTPGAITVSGSTDYTFTGAGSLSGVANLSKAGSGTLRLENTGANALTGTMTVNGGKLAVTAAYAMSTGGVILNDGATLASVGDKSIGRSLTVNGSVALGDAVDTGTLAFTSAVTFGQGATVTSNVATTFSGTVSLGTALSFAGPAAATVSSALALSGPTTLTVSGAGGVTLSGIVSGAQSLAKDGSGTLVLTGANTYSGGTTVTGGVLQFGAGGATGTLPAGAVSIASGAELRLNRSDTTTTLANSLSGAGIVRLIGPGTSGNGSYTVSGGNTALTGGWVVGAGARLNAGALANLGSGDISVLATGNLFVAGNYTVANNLTLAGRGWAEASGELGALRLSGGTVTGAITLAADAAIAAHTSSGTLAGAIGESGGARKLTFGHAYTGATGTALGTSAGSITVSGNNTYTGGTDLVGVVAVTAASSTAFGTGLVAIGNEATRAATLTLANGVTLANAVTLGANAGAAGGVIQLVGTASAGISGRVTVSSLPGTGPLFGLGSGTLSLTGGIDSSSALSLNAGNYVLAGGGTYPSLSLAGGSIRLGGANGLGSTGAGAATFTLGSASAATLDLNGFSQTSGVLLATTAGLTVTNTSATLSTLRLENTGTFSNSLGFSGNLALVLAGANAKTLSSSNSHSGGTTVAAGSLSLTTLAPLGTGGLALDGGSLSLANPSAAVLSGALTGSGSLAKSGQGTLTLANASGYTGEISVAAGGLVVTAASLGGSAGAASRLTVVDGASLAGGFATARDIRIVGGDGVVSAGGLLRAGSGSAPGVLALTGTLELGWLDEVGGTGSTRLNVLVGASSADRIDLTGGTLRLLDTVQVSFLNGGFGDGTYQILAYDVANPNNVLTGSLSTVGNYGHTTVSPVVHDAVAGTFSVTVTKASMVWTGDQGSAVDGTTANFRLSTTSAADSLLAGDELIFNDTAAVRNLTLAAGIPTLGRVTVDTALGYAFSGSGGFTGETAQLVKSGSGTLTLGGVNTFGGGILLNAGTLEVAADAALGDVAGGLTLAAGSTLRATSSFTLASTRALTLAGNATVSVDTAASLSYEGAVAGTGGLSKSGAGTLVLGGASTYAGATTVSAGTLRVTGTLGPAGTYAGAIANDGALEFASASGQVLSGAITGAGSLSKTGAGTLTLEGTNTYAGATTVSAGTLRVTGTLGAAGTYAGAIANGGALEFASASGQVLSGAITGAGSLSKTGAGTLTLEGTNTYAGATTVSAGTLVVRVGSLPGNATNNAALVFDQASDATYSGVVSGAGSLSKAGSGILTLGSAQTLTGAVTVSAGTLRQGVASAIAPASRLTVASGASFDVNGLAGLSGKPVTLAGTGVAGATGVLAAALYNNTATGVALGTVTLSGNATIAAAPGGSNAAAPSRNSLGSVDLGGFTLTLSGSGADNPGYFAFSNQSFSNGNVVATNGAALYISPGGGTPSFFTDGRAATLTLQSNSYLSARDYNWTANVLNPIAVVLDGGAIASAGTTINGGFWFDSSATNGGGSGFQNFQSSVTVAAGGGRIISNNTAFGIDFSLAGSLSGSGDLLVTGGRGVILRGDTSGYTGTLTTNASGITFSPNAATQAFSGIIAGAGGVTKSASGTLTLSAANTFSGGATVSAGTLVLTNAQAAGSGTLNVAGGSVIFDSSVLANAFTVGGLAGSSNLALANNAATPAGITLTFGSNNADTTFSGVLSGPGSLVKLGTGTLTLSSANTFAGGVTVGSNNGGTNDPSLVISAATGLGTGSLRVLADAAYSPSTYASAGSPFLRITPTSANFANAIEMPSAAGLYAIQRGVAADTSSTPGIAILSGVISGGGSGVVLQFDHPTAGQGISTFQLDAANTFLGTLRLNRGRLIVNHLSALGDSSNLVHLQTNSNTTDGNLVFGVSGTFANPILVATANNTFHTQANNVTLSGPVSGTVAFTKIGGGTLTLSGANTHSGGMTLSAGTLEVAGSGQLNLGAYAGAIANNAALVFSGTADQTLSGAITGTGTLAKSGAGNLVLTGANTFSGGTSLSGGITRFSSGSLGSAGSVSVNGATLEWGASNTQDLSARLALGASGATLDIGANNVAFAAGLAAAGNLTKAGAGTLTLGAAGSVAGSVSIQAGKLVLGDSASVGSSAIALAANTTLTLGFTPASALTFANALTGSGAIEVATTSETNLVTLANLSGFTGSLRLVSGYLDNAAYAGALTYVGGKLTNASALAGTLIVEGRYAANQGLPADVLLRPSGILDFAGVAGAPLASTVRYVGGSLDNAAAFTGTLDVQVSGLTLATGTLGSGTVRLGTGLSATVGANFANDVRLEGTASLTNDLSDFAATVVLGNLAAYNLGTNPDFVRTASFRLTSGSRLRGQGVTGDLTVQSGGILAPGNSPGTVTVDGNMVLQSGGILEFEVLSALGAVNSPVAGTDYDTLVVTGELDLSALSSANRFVLDLISLANANTAGDLADFDPADSHQFVLIQYGTLDLGANSALGANLSSLFTIDTTGFTDQAGLEVALGWSVINDNATSSIILTYAPIPEPSTYGLALGALALAAAAIRRRVRRPSGTAAPGAS